MNEIIMDNVWYADHDSLYILQESGYRKGHPILENKFHISIQGKASDQEKQELVERLQKFLNRV